MNSLHKHTRTFEAHILENLVRVNKDQIEVRTRGRESESTRKKESSLNVIDNEGVVRLVKSLIVSASAQVYSKQYFSFLLV